MRILKRSARTARGLPALLLCAGAVLGLAAGCRRLTISENPRINRAAFNANPPQSIAVLPFSNSSGVKGADVQAREAFRAAVSALNYRDVEIEKVDSTLAQLAADRQLSPSELPPTLIREADLAEAVLAGEVLKVSKMWFLLYSRLKVRVRLKLIDTRTEKVLYENQARGLNQRFSVPLGPISLVKSTLQTLWDLRGEEIAETMEEFSKKVVKGFPDYPVMAQQGQYYLRNIKFMVPHNPLRPGEALGLIFNGTPGQKAYFDLGGIAKDIPVAEISPGRYGVRYTIQPGQSAPYCVVTCKLAGGGQLLHVTLHRQPFAVGAGQGDAER